MGISACEFPLLGAHSMGTYLYVLSLFTVALTRCLTSLMEAQESASANNSH